VAAGLEGLRASAEPEPVGVESRAGSGAGWSGSCAKSEVDSMSSPEGFRAPESLVPPVTFVSVVAGRAAGMPAAGDPAAGESSETWAESAICPGPELCPRSEDLSGAACADPARSGPEACPEPDVSVGPEGCSEPEAWGGAACTRSAVSAGTATPVASKDCRSAAAPDASEGCPEPATAVASDGWPAAAASGASREGRWAPSPGSPGVGEVRGAGWWGVTRTRAGLPM
jgi:hypothetical protein